MNLPKSRLINTASLSLLLIIILFIVGWVGLRPPKIGYVRSQELVYNYIGMNDVQNKLDDQRQLWQSNFDSLELDYRNSVHAYRKDYRQLSGEERNIRENALRIQEANIDKYSNAIEKQSAELEEKMVQGVLNQVNSFAESYGKNKGFDIIFGTTLSGSILYGNDAMDITDEVLAALNNNYKGNETAR